MKHGSETAATRPISIGTGRALKEALRKHRPDAEWAAELHELRKAIGPGQTQIDAAAARKRP